MTMMDSDIHIQQFNEVECRLVGDKGVLREIQEHFSFFAESYKFHPKFKAGMWDGKIRALNLQNRLINKGLIPALVEFCNDNKITYSLDDALFPKRSFNIDNQDVIDFYKAIKGPYVPKDYQIEAVKTCVNSNRSIILSPTASGKSYFLYGLARFYQKLSLKVLIVVHRAQLVKQLIEDNFCEEYDQGRESFTHNTIYSGQDKYKEAEITASTWQSIVNLPEEFFKKYDVILADEVHAWKATSCISIMSKCKHIVYRHGTSGTLDDIKANQMTLEGLFGPPTQVAFTSELIDSGDVAKLKVIALVLNYSKEDCKLVSKLDYKQEIDFIQTHPERMKFLKKLIKHYKGNTLVAFRHKDHGKAILEIVEGDKFFINGSIDIDIRSKYSKHMDTHEDVTGVVSLGTFAEGINIKNVSRVILACPLKSKVKLLQLIGRGLRLSDIYDQIIFVDIADNLRYNKRNNYALIHAIDRYKRYKDEKFVVEPMEYDL